MFARFLTSALLAVLCLSPSGVCHPQASDGAAQQEDAKKIAHKKAEEANRLVARGEWKQALEAAREAVAADPSSAEAHYALGVAMEAGGELDAAEAEYKKMGLLAPESLLELSLVRIYLRQGRVAEAEQMARRAVTKNRWVPQAHLSLGAVCMRKKDYPGAIAAFQQAVQVAPQDWGARLSLADAFRQAGRFDEALTQYSQAQAMRPEHPDAWVGRAQVWEQMGRPGEAIVAYEKALEVAGENYATTSVEHRLARLYLSVTDAALQKPQRAVELARAAAQATEFRDAAILGTLAQACDSAGDRDCASEARQKLQSLTRK